MEASGTAKSITALLGNLGRDPDAQSVLIQRLYGELRRLARIQMRRERNNHTLQPTALVNEAYARLMQSPEPAIAWQSRAHFLAAAAQAMRRILVDYARARNAWKRGGFQQQVTLEDCEQVNGERSIDILALNEALECLAELDSRQSRIVELHFFGGLSFEEIAELLGIAVRTVKRDWSMARSWLFNQLSARA